MHRVTNVRLSAEARIQVLAAITGLVVFTTFFPGHKPWVQLGWLNCGLFALLSGVLIQLCSIAVLAGYRTVHKHIFPPDDLLTPLQAELEAKEVLIVFCISLLAVCTVLYFHRIGMFEGMGGAEELSLR